MLHQGCTLFAVTYEVLRIGEGAQMVLGLRFAPVSPTVFAGEIQNLYREFGKIAQHKALNLRTGRRRHRQRGMPVAKGPGRYSSRHRYWY